ncbi:MAG TPA: undecaprenyl/decaprenyl-phosphate alpha-N-acetylglucosaminyl 1-phosphate transferase [Actinobacteria bacterium]|nr:undecaprenyl/decaprenyl-phosphate alpha-N-acetylglucosaminyl 1-phosphate transferase [Actinomycetota bacterium]
MNIYLIHLLILFAASVLALFFTPRVMNLAKSIGALDYPAERSIHSKAVPRLGGGAIMGAFGVSIVAYIVYKLSIGDLDLTAYWQQNRALAGILLGSFAIFAVGVIDDIYDVKPMFKFGGQLAAALITVSFGVTVDFLGSPLSETVINIPYWLGTFLAIFWIVALTNTINFIDGLDGLASGVAGISSVALYIIAIQTGRLDIALALVAMLGALLGFLKYNFNPAKIFMGDSGSMLLGFFLGAITIQSAAKSAATVALLVPIVIMGIPIFDAAYAIWRRFVNRRPITRADKEHIHHILLHKGLTHRATVLIIYGWTLVLSSVGLSMQFFGGYMRIFILTLLLPVSALLAYYSGLFDWIFGLNNKEEQ